MIRNNDETIFFEIHEQVIRNKKTYSQGSRKIGNATLDARCHALLSKPCIEDDSMDEALALRAD